MNLVGRVAHGPARANACRSGSPVRKEEVGTTSELAYPVFRARIPKDRLRPRPRRDAAASGLGQVRKNGPEAVPLLAGAEAPAHSQVAVKEDTSTFTPGPMVEDSAARCR